MDSATDYSKESLMLYLKYALAPSAENLLELSSLLSHENIEKLTNCLVSSDEEMSEIAVDLLTEILNLSIGLDAVADMAFHDLMAKSVDHPSVKLRRSVARSLLKLTSTENGIQSLFATGNVIIIVHLLEDKELGVVNIAQQAIIELLKQPAAHDAFAAFPCALDQLQILIADGKNDELAMRALDCFAETAALESQNGFKFCEATGVLNKIVLGIVEAKADLLLLLNYLSFLEKIAKSADGVSFLCEKTTLFPRIHELAMSSSDETVLGFVIRFIANFGQKGDRECALAIEYKWCTSILTHLVSSSSSVILLETCIDAIGSICSVQRGMLFFMEHENAFAFFTDLVNSSVGRPVRAALLHSLATIFDSNCSSSEYQVVFFRKFFECSEGDVSSSPRFSQIMSFRREFDVDIRMGTYHLLHALSRKSWSAITLGCFPGFFDWLTNRKLETCMEGHEWKYGIAQRLAMIPEFSKLGADPHQTQELKTFFEGWPVFFCEICFSSDCGTSESLIFPLLQILLLYF